MNIRKEIEEDSYEPFGPEWEQQLMKLPKKALIDLFRNACIDLQKLKNGTEEKPTNVN